MSDEQALATAENETKDQESGEEKDLLTRMKEAIDVDIEDIGPLRRKLAITVPRSLLDEQLDEQYGELSRDALIPGFRKGRAPRRLIEKRFGREVNDQIRSQILGQGYLAAVEKAEIKAVSDPMIRLSAGLTSEPSASELVTVRDALDRLEIPSEGDLRFECEVEIQPEFELPELEKIPLSRPRISIADEDVDEYIDRLRAMRGTFEPVTGKIKTDDLIIADAIMKVGDRIVQRQENLQFAARGQNVFGVPVPEFGKAAAGRQSGDAVSVACTIPEDYDRTEFRGQKGTLEITVHEVKRMSLPAIDREFLGTVGFDSEKELRRWVREDLESRLGDTIQEGLRNQVIQYLLDKTEIDLPAGLSSRQTDRVVARKMLDLRRRGVPDSVIEKHIDEMRTGAKDEAAAQLKVSFIMDRIAEARDVHVSEEEVNAQIARIATRYNRRFDRVRDDLSKGDGLAALYIQIRDEKIVDQLIADAKISEKAGRSESAKSATKSRAGDSKRRTAAAKPQSTTQKAKPAKTAKATRKKAVVKKKST